MTGIRCRSFLWIVDQAVAPAHLAHTQAFPLDASGTRSITAGVKTASKHQQRSGLVSVNLAFSMAQTFGSWQIGQRVGSMVFIRLKPISLERRFQSRIA